MNAIMDRLMTSLRAGSTGFLLLALMLVGFAMFSSLGNPGREAAQHPAASRTQVAAQSAHLPQALAPVAAEPVAAAEPAASVAKAAAPLRGSRAVRAGRHGHKLRMARATAPADLELFTAPTGPQSVARAERPSANLKEVAAEVSRTATLAPIAMPQELSDQQPPHLALQEPVARPVELARAMQLDGDLQPLTDKELAAVRGGGGSEPGSLGVDTPAT